ncbi:hypothetical protein NDN08_008260 [Rhodosorus marinus]|uniref:Right handed beta helix domain-containing protein n=1 Tax=Rhodosorus marinus TaxID=101924 RepID=A0AAV8V024_9RHOD|nr:hypothetical protein NDN08_008260 [Rhodosorus marinus]
MTNIAEVDGFLKAAGLPSEEQLDSFRRSKLEISSKKRSRPALPTVNDKFRKHPGKHDVVISPTKEEFLQAMEYLNSSDDRILSGGRIFFNCPHPNQTYRIYLDDLVLINNKAWPDKRNWNQKFSIVAPHANVTFLPTERYAPKCRGLFRANHAADVYIYGLTFMNASVSSDACAREEYGSKWHTMSVEDRKTAVAQYGGAAYQQRKGPRNGLPITFHRTAFLNNHVTSSEARGGGAINTLGTHIEVWDSIFVGNSGAAGGAIAGKQIKLYLFSSNFIGNWSTGGRDSHQLVANGGALRCDGIKLGHLCGCYFRENFIKPVERMKGTAATLYGAQQPEGDILVEHCRFHLNGTTGSRETECILNLVGNMNIIVRDTVFDENRVGSDKPNKAVVVAFVAGGFNINFHGVNFVGNQYQAGYSGKSIRLKRKDSGGHCSVTNCFEDRKPIEGLGFAK